jgi:hypothetical protein
VGPRRWSGWKEATACGAWFVRRRDRRARRPKQRVRHCWCWACRIVGCGNRGSRPWPLLEVLKISPASTAIASGEEKSRKTSHFQAIDPRAVFDVAVDNLPSAGDSQQPYRPRESLQISSNGRCARCGRYLTAFIKYLLLLVVTSLPTRAHQSRLERVCSRGGGSREPCRLTGPTNLQSGFYAHLGQADRASGSRPGCELLLPSPRLVLSAATKGGSRGGILLR